MSNKPKIDASRIVVVMPNWLGDGVMATPFLRGLRTLYPEARIAAVCRSLVASVCEGLVDDVKISEKGQDASLIRWLKAEPFDLGVLLPNSLRSAWILWRGGTKRRLGYARDGRSVFLTDRLHARKVTPDRMAEDRKKSETIKQLGGGNKAIGSAFEPVPTIDYYLELLTYLRADGINHERTKDERTMVLAVAEPERQEAEAVLSSIGIGPAEPMVVLVPGANFGASKCWMPERFAEVADRIIETYGARVLLVNSPAEEEISQLISGSARHAERIYALSRYASGKGVSLGAVKEIVRRSRMMICNDTGPRHMAVAFGVPVVTLFGPTDPVWAETFFDRERIVRVPVPCGPCQLKVCPIDHRCMKGITVEMVMEKVRELWLSG